MSVFTRAPKIVGRVARRFVAFVGSPHFFWAILIVFALQALWIAWSGAYSMAYDEFFHLAAIQEYAKHWLPIATESVAHPELGAFSRDPSFLYHYLMSFPYHLITAVWHSFTSQIIVLRIINIGLFLGGMVFFWKTLLRAGLSQRVTNVVLFVFSLVPTFVMVAAQLNYDNMVFLVSGATLYLATDFILQLKQKQMINIVKVALLLSLLLAGSVVKYAFLPVAGAIGIVLLVEVIVAFRRKIYSFDDVKKSISSARKLWLGVAVILLLASAALFGERIGGNIVRYHTPAPDCAQVLNYDQCLSHDAYARNANYVNLKLSDQLDMSDKLTYPISWFQQMLREAFFAVGPKQIGYPTGAPLQPAFTAGYIIAVGLLVLLIASFVWLVRSNPVWRLWLIASVSYIGVLFALNYKEYLRLGVPVAIHGRYAVPVIILIGALGVVALQRVIGARWRRLTQVAAVLLVTMLIWGGGWLPWIIRSSDNWVWPHAVTATRAIRSIFWHTVIK